MIRLINSMSLKEHSGRETVKIKHYTVFGWESSKNPDSNFLNGKNIIWRPLLKTLVTIEFEDGLILEETWINDLELGLNDGPAENVEKTIEDSSHNVIFHLNENKENVKSNNQNEFDLLLHNSDLMPTYSSIHPIIVDSEKTGDKIKTQKVTEVTPVKKVHFENACFKYTLITCLLICDFRESFHAVL
ncbi:hypothetical protein FQA39_LY03125 [Lamprigera yunnana]|nr:hypothetical protein FQA39_LY03125 [Lamprigera yunnana]